MAKCKVVLPIDKVSERVLALLKSDTKRNKSVKFAATTVTNETNADGEQNDMAVGLGQIFGSYNDKDNKSGDLKKFLKGGFTSIYQKMSTILGKGSELVGVNPFLKMLNNEDSSKTIEELNANVIVMTHMIGKLSDPNSMLPTVKLKHEGKINDWSVEDRKKLHSYNGVVAMDEIEHVIGTEILRAQGKKITGELLSSHFEIAKIGRAAIDQAIKDGLLSEATDGKVYSSGVVDGSGGFVESTGNGRHKARATKVVKLGSKFTKGNKEGKLSTDNLETIDNLYGAIKEVRQITAPGFVGIPSSEAQLSDTSVDDIVVDKLRNGVRDLVQRGANTVNPKMLGIFKELKELWEKSKKDEVKFKTLIQNTYKTDSEKFMKDVLGISVYDNVDNVNAASEQGKEVTAFNPLIAMMENYDSVFGKDGEPSEFFFTFFFAGTGRLFLNETMVQFQADKNMQRHMTEASEKSEYEGDDLDSLIKRVAVNYGISPDAIIGVGEVPTMFSVMMDFMDNIDEDQENAGMILKTLSSNLDKTGIDSVYVWEQLKALSVIKDIRDGIVIKDGKINYSKSKVESGYLSESDATASGIILKMMQNLHLPAVQNALLRMGIGLETDMLEAYRNGEISLAKAWGKDEGTAGYEGVYINDAYAFGIEAYEALELKAAKKLEMLEKYKDKESAEYRDAKELAYNSNNVKQVSRINQLKKLLGKNNRDVLKMFIMKLAYGQKGDNNAADFATEVVQEVMGDTQSVNKLLEIYDVELGPYKGKMSLAEQIEATDKLEDVIANSTGTFITTKILDPIYEKGFFSEVDANIVKIAKYESGLDNRVNAKGNAIVEDSVNLMNSTHKILWAKANDKGQYDSLEEQIEAEHKEFDQAKGAKYQMGVDKMRQTQITSKDGKSTSIRSLKHFNEVSSLVLGTHMKDASVLVLSLYDAYNAMVEAEYGGDFSKVSKKDMKELLDKVATKNPANPVHDSITMPPKTVGFAEKAYEQRINDAAYYYDDVLEMFKSIRFKLGNTEMSAEMLELEREAKANFAARRRFMQPFRNDDGTWKTIPNSFETDMSDSAIDRVNTKWADKTGNKTTSKKEPKSGNTKRNTNEAADSLINEFVESGELQYGVPKEFVVFDFETNWDGVLGKGRANTKEEIAGLTPNEIAAKRIRVTLNEDGSLTTEVIGELHKALNMTKEAGELNDRLIKEAGVTGYNTYETIKNMNVDKVGTKTSMLKHLKEFIGDSTIVTFKGTSFDVIIAGVDNKHHDLHSVGRNFRPKHFRDTSKLAGKQTEYYDAMIDRKDKIDTNEAHSALVDIDIAIELFNEMTSQLVNDNVQEISEEVMPSTRTKVGATRLGTELNEVFVSDKELAKIKKANEAYKGKVVEGEAFEYDTETGVITVVKPAKDNDVTDAMYEVYLAHEIKHAVTYDWLKDNQGSPEFKYLLKSLQKATKELDPGRDPMSNLLADRLQYASDTVGDLGKVAEIVAILASEPNIREAFLKEFPQQQKSRLTKILDMIKEFMGLHDVDTSIVLEVIDRVVEQGTEYEQGVKVRLKVVEALNELSTVKEAKHGGTSQAVLSTIRLKNKLSITKKLADKGVSKEQIEFVFEYMKQNNIEEISSKELVERVMFGLVQSVEVKSPKNLTLSVDQVNYILKRLYTHSSPGIRTQIDFKGEERLREIIFNADIDAEDGVGYFDEIYYELMNSDKQYFYVSDTVNIEDINDAKDFIVDSINSVTHSNFRNKLTYSNLAVPGGINYKEMEISTPNVTATKKGHADFATDKGIGWYRVDDAETEQSKTLRVLEMQSDMFQKMKDKDLSTVENNGKVFNEGTEAYEDATDGTDLNKAFHQMLNTDNKWVKFFIQSIVQDAQKKGYKHIRFPSGETVAKVEGHIPFSKVVQDLQDKVDAYIPLTTKEVKDFKEAIVAAERATKTLEADSKAYNSTPDALKIAAMDKELDNDALGDAEFDMLNREYSKLKKKHEYAHPRTKLNRLMIAAKVSFKVRKHLETKKELAALLKKGIADNPIEAFYQIRVKNTLVKTYGKTNVQTVKDEHGNEWFEVSLDAKRDRGPILLAAKKKKPSTKKQSELKLGEIKYKAAEIDTGYGDPITAFSTDTNNYIAKFMQAGVYEPVGGLISVTAKEGHNLLKDNWNLYSDFVDVVDEKWESSDTVQQMKKYTWGIEGLDILDEINISAHNAHQKLMERMSKLVIESDSLMSKAGIKTDAQMKLLDDVFAKSAIFGITDNGLLNRLVKGEELGDLIAEMEKVVTDNNGKIELAKDMAMLYQNKLEVGKTIGVNFQANDVTRFVSNTNNETTQYKAYEALTALYALNEVDGSVKELRRLANGNVALRKVYSDMVANAVAIKTEDNMVHGEKDGRHVDANTSRGNLIDDTSAVNSYTKYVSYEDMQKGKVSEKDGWKILRVPSKKVPGIAYRENTTSMKDGGAGLNVSYIKTGVSIPSNADVDMSKVATARRLNADGEYDYSLILTEQERKTLSYYDKPSNSLIRAYAHKRLILETQTLRDTFISGLRVEYATAHDVNMELTKLIKDNEHPIFVKIDKVSLNGKTKADGTQEYVVDKAIRDKYTPVETSMLSDVGGFNRQVSWIRKDVVQDVQGYKQKDLFTKHSWNVTHKKVKQMVSYGKTATIILNPAKIGVDFLSGITLAMAKGASFVEAFQYTKEAIKYSKELVDARNKVMIAEFNLAKDGTGSKVLKNRLKRAQKELDNHPFSPALAGGFIQSLGMDILGDLDTAQGLQVSIESIMSKLNKNDKGELNKFNNIVKSMANSGGMNFQMDHVYTILGEKLEANELGHKPGHIIKTMGEHLRTIKSQEDMTQYLAELVAAPNSSLVRLGGAMTVYADLIPRWIIYRHNINEGMSEQEALADARKSLPDYTKNMPESLQGLSDMYFTPFPSFFTRVPKIAYELAKNHPVAFGLQWFNAYSILSTNPLSKAMNGSLISLPSELNYMPYYEMW